MHPACGNSWQIHLLSSQYNSEINEQNFFYLLL